MHEFYKRDTQNSGTIGDTDTDYGISIGMCKKEEPALHKNALQME